MRKILGLSILAATLISEAALAMALKLPPTATLAPWGAFSQSSADGRDTTTVEVESVTRENSAGVRPETTWINEKTEQIWVAEKHVRRSDGSETRQWADSGRCYQLIETLVTLADLDESPRPALVVVGGPIADKVYSLQGFGVRPAREGQGMVRLAAGAAVPVGSVIDAALKAWAPCWSDAPPSLGAP